MKNLMNLDELPKCLIMTFHDGWEAYFKISEEYKAFLNDEPIVKVYFDYISGECQIYTKERHIKYTMLEIPDGSDDAEVYIDFENDSVRFEPCNQY